MKKKTRNLLLLAAAGYLGYRIYKGRAVAAVAAPTPTGDTPQDKALVHQANGGQPPVEVVENYYIEDVPDIWTYGYGYPWGGGWGGRGGGGHHHGGHHGGHHH